MKTNDYVKYMTQQFVKYIDTPRDERKERKEVRKKQKRPLHNTGSVFYPMVSGYG